MSETTDTTISCVRTQTAEEVNRRERKGLKEGISSVVFVIYAVKYRNLWPSPNLWGNPGRNLRKYLISRICDGIFLSGVGGHVWSRGARPSRSHTLASRRRKGLSNVFRGTPKTAGETPALPGTDVSSSFPASGADFLARLRWGGGSWFNSHE